MPDIVIAGATFPSVPAVDLPKSGSGTARFWDMSGEYAWLGKGAECVDDAVYSIEDSLANTSFNGWTPSTTAKAIVASKTAKTFKLDMANNDYYLMWECGVDPVYDGSETEKALTVMTRNLLIQEIIKRPSTWANIEAGSFNGNASTNLFTANNFLRYYGTTTGTITYSWGVSYGFYFGATAATFNNTTDAATMTIKTPTLTTRCSTTYFSTTNAGHIDQAESKWWIRGKLFRVEPDGVMRGAFERLVRLINEE